MANKSATTTTQHSPSPSQQPSAPEFVTERSNVPLVSLSPRLIGSGNVLEFYCPCGCQSEIRLLLDAYRVVSPEGPSSFKTLSLGGAIRHDHWTGKITDGQLVGDLTRRGEKAAAEVVIPNAGSASATSSVSGTADTSSLPNNGTDTAKARDDHDTGASD